MLAARSHGTEHHIYEIIIERTEEGIFYDHTQILLINISFHNGLHVHEHMKKNYDFYACIQRNITYKSISVLPD